MSSIFYHSGHKVKPWSDDKNKFEWFCETCNEHFKIVAKPEKETDRTFREIKKRNEWINFLEEVLEYVSNIDCEEPAGLHCSRIDTDGGEEACMPCRCKEAYEKITSSPHSGEKQ